MKRSSSALAAFALLIAAMAPALGAVHGGDALPALSVPNASGGTLTSSAYRGKPLYVNFFASWCGPCNDEAPAIKAFYQKYRKRGLAVVGINELENAATAREFAKKYRWPFAVGVDADGNALSPYQAIGLPVHVFVDRRGKISTYRNGQMDPDEIEAAIKKIL